jgi:hypothetical protein
MSYSECRKKNFDGTSLVLIQRLEAYHTDGQKKKKKSNGRFSSNQMNLIGWQKKNSPTAVYSHVFFFFLAFFFFVVSQMDPGLGFAFFSTMLFR